MFSLFRIDQTYVRHCAERDCPDCASSNTAEHRHGANVAGLERFKVTLKVFCGLSGSKHSWRPSRSLASLSNSTRSQTRLAGATTHNRFARALSFRRLSPSNLLTRINRTTCVAAQRKTKYRLTMRNDPAVRRKQSGCGSNHGVRPLAVRSPCRCNYFGWPFRR